MEDKCIILLSGGVALLSGLVVAGIEHLFRRKHMKEELSLKEKQELRRELEADYIKFACRTVISHLNDLRFYILNISAEKTPSIEHWNDGEYRVAVTALSEITGQLNKKKPFEAVDYFVLEATPTLITIKQNYLPLDKTKKSKYDEAMRLFRELQTQTEEALFLYRVLRESIQIALKDSKKSVQQIGEHPCVKDVITKMNEKDFSGEGWREWDPDNYPMPRLEWESYHNSP